MLESKLEQSFSHIARHHFHRSKDPQFSDQVVKAYWPHCTERITSPPARVLKEATSAGQWREVVLNVRSEVESTTLKKNVAKSDFTTTKLWFPTISVDTDIKHSRRRYAKVSWQTQKEDHQRGLQAMVEMAKRQAEESDVFGRSRCHWLTISEMKRLRRCVKFKMKKEEEPFKVMFFMLKRKNFVVAVLY